MNNANNRAADLSNSTGAQLSMLTDALELLSDRYHNGEITKADYETGFNNLQGRMAYVKASVR